MDVYGFAGEDLEAARRTIESALSIPLEQAQEESSPGGCYFRWYVPNGPCVQLRRNSGPYQRWQGDPSHPWHPTYGLLVFVHGPARETVCERLRHDVPGLLFLENKDTM